MKNTIEICIGQGIARGWQNEDKLQMGYDSNKIKQDNQSI